MPILCIAFNRAIVEGCISPDESKTNARQCILLAGCDLYKNFGSSTLNGAAALNENNIIRYHSIRYHINRDLIVTINIL